MTLATLLRTKVAALALTWAGAAVHAAGDPKAPLEPGARAPLVNLQAARAGQVQPYSLRQALASGPVVLYFYPAAFSRGCSIQAKAFANQVEQFRAAGASIVGVSLDGIATLREFSADPHTCAGKLTVASDADGRVATSYGVPVKATEAGKQDSRGQPVPAARADRTTFVVDRDGRIAATLGSLSPLANVDQALAAVQKLATLR